MLLRLPSLVLALLFCPGSVLADGRRAGAVEPLPRPQAAHVLPQPELGEWLTRVQLVWDADAGNLVRRRVRVWDNLPGQPMDFLWLPDTPGVASDGLVAGAGRLIWREKNTSTADHDAVVGVYRGTLVDGKAHGFGAYAHRSGFTYEGEWVAGLMHGTGRLRSPLGSQFSGTFRQGRPHGESELIDAFGEVFTGSVDDAVEPTVTLAQYAQHGEVRIGVAVASAAPVDPWITRIEYASTNRDGAVVVFPGDAEFRRAWLGNGGDLGIVGTPVTSVVEGAAWGDPYWDQPVELRLAVRNDSTAKLGISRARLVVKQSVPALNPLVNARVSIGQMRDCYVGPLGMFSARIMDAGWARIEDSVLRVHLGTQPAPAATVGEARVGPIDGIAYDVDVAGAFAQVGIGADLLGNLRSCSASALGLLPRPVDELGYDEHAALRERGLPVVEQCFERLRGTGRLGPAEPHLRLHDGRVGFDYVTTYAYAWVDHAGQRRRSSRVFPDSADLGELFDAQCGGAEGGDTEAFRGNAVMLKSEGTDYQVRVPLRATVDPGEERLWSVLVSAEKSSVHEFSFMLEAGGKRLTSQPITLVYFRPNHRRMQDTGGAPPPERTWIQLASSRSADEASTLACRFGQTLDEVSVYRAMNDWHAVVAGPGAKADMQARAQVLKQRGAIPSDAAVTNGERFIERIDHWQRCSN